MSINVFDPMEEDIQITELNKFLFFIVMLCEQSNPFEKIKDMQIK